MRVRSVCRLRGEGVQGEGGGDSGHMRLGILQYTPVYSYRYSRCTTANCLYTTLHTLLQFTMLLYSPVYMFAIYIHT